MKVRVKFREINYGYVDVEVDETKVSGDECHILHNVGTTKPDYMDEIEEKAWDKIENGDVAEWERTDTDIISWWEK